MKKYLSFLMIGLLILTVGCGGDDAKPETNPKEKEKLVVGSNPTFAPFEFVDDQGKVTGFDMDLIDAIAEHLDMEVELRTVAFDGLIPALQEGSIDVAMSGITITEKRKESILFSDPYYQSGLSILVLKDNETIQSFEDLKGKKVAVQLGSTSAIAIAKIEGVEVVQFNHTPEAFLELKNSGVEAVVNDLPALQDFLKKEGAQDFKVVGGLLENEYLGMGFSKEKGAMAQKINEALGELKENGKYDEIYEKWFGEKPLK